MSHSHDPISNKPRPKADYTDKDVQIRPLLLFFFWTAIFCVVVMVSIRAYLNHMEAVEVEKASALPAFVSARQLPPENMPRIQVRPRDELAEHHAFEQALVNGGVVWADAGKTRVRIPVTNAMEILLARPDAFPARAK